MPRVWSTIESFVTMFVSKVVMRPFRLALLAFVLIPSLAMANAEPAKRFVERNHDEVEKILSKPRTDARDAALTAVLDGFLDYDELAKRSLGAEWDSKSPAQRRQFTSLLKQLVQRSYTNNLERTLKFQVRYLAAEEAEDLVVVKTEARDRKNRRAPPVSIDYRVLPLAGGFRVVDVITDGVSLVENYRKQFTRTLKRESWGALIEKMERRLREGDETAN
jgi:phospholipid transport system substrate-binding protein